MFFIYLSLKVPSLLTNLLHKKLHKSRNELIQLLNSIYRFSPFNIGYAAKIFGYRIKRATQEFKNNQVYESYLVQS